MFLASIFTIMFAEDMKVWWVEAREGGSEVRRGIGGWCGGGVRRNGLWGVEVEGCMRGRRVGGWDCRES